MMRNIVFFFLLLLLKSYNAERQKRSKVFTFLRSDAKLPGPSMMFDKSLASGVFEFEFKTFVNRALVLYQDDEGKSDHIQVTIQNGFIDFSFFVNQDENPQDGITFRSNYTYNDFQWHSLRIERNASYTSIVLDNGKERENFATFGYQSKFLSKLLIGGFRKGQNLNDLSNPSVFWFYLSPFSKRRGFFNACVRNIKYGQTEKEMKEISNDYIEKYKVTEGCTLNYCHKPVPICENNGRCTPNGTNKVTCDCLWTGYEGKYCDKEALELTLDGTYKVVNHKVDISSAIEKYTFRIKTLRENAVLFYARGPPNYADMMLIEIRQSRLKMVLNPGGGRGGRNMTVISEQKISDGKWHFVQYAKGRKYYTLKVDAKIKRSGRFGEYFKMDYDKNSYLGEISKPPYKNVIKIQDFIWEAENRININFVTGLCDKLRGYKGAFSVLPVDALPRFSGKLPANSTSKPTTILPSSTPQPVNSNV